MLRCDEVTRMVASDELAEADWSRRLRIHLHLLWCVHCRRYAAQLRGIGKLARDLWGPASEDEATLERLRRDLAPPSTTDRSDSE